MQLGVHMKANVFRLALTLLVGCGCARAYPGPVPGTEDIPKLIAASSLVCKGEVAAIVLIAEFTTNEGPYVDDYFLTFVTVENGKALYATCSFYAEGRDSALSEISHQVGCPIEVGLAVPFAIQPWRG